MICPEGLSLIKEFEGLKCEAYQDGGGVWTLGYGTTLGVKEGDTCTEEWANSRLVQDLKDFEEGVYRLVKVPLNANKMAALVSFTYNLGLKSLEKSTLLKLINESKFLEAAEEFPKWCKVKGFPCDGLRRRRILERKLFLT